MEKVSAANQIPAITPSSMELVSIAILSPANGEEAGRLIEEARSQSWGKKEILVVDAPEGLLPRARGEWIQWLREGERLSPTKIEEQLAQAGKLPRGDLLASPYRLGGGEGALALDPRREPLSYVARLGRAFPFVGPLLWSRAALRAFLRQKQAPPSRMRIGLGERPGCDCPGVEREPTRAEWSRVLAWALALAAAAQEEGAGRRLSPEGERLLSLLEEVDASLVPKPRNLLAQARHQANATREGLRQMEAGFRRGRRQLLHRIGLRKRPGTAGRAGPEAEAYAAWLAAYQALDEADREEIRKEIGRFPRKPLLSVLLPVFNTPERWLQRAIDSIREQLYPHWELCLADDGSTLPHIRPLLERNREGDPRIRVVFREESGGIAAASNSALALARGEWIVLVDHDDELPEEAFFLVAREILRDPEIRLLYSDEDKIDEAGRPFHPCFKPDFSYDLLLSENCINHLGVYQAELFHSLGGFRSGFDGSQDYDLALRFVEKLEARQIRHIPRVLYHWRAIETSGAAREEAKPYAYEAARKAIRDHLERLGESAEVLSTRIPWGHRVRRRVPGDLSVSLLLGSGSDEEGLWKAIGALRGEAEPSKSELLVIGRSKHGLPLPKGVRVLDPPELTGPALWSWAARQARGEVLVFLAAPVEPAEGGWLAELASHAVRPEVGAVGARILAPDGRVEEAGVVIGLEGSAGAAFRGGNGESIGYFGQSVLIRNPSAVSAACLATRRALFAECGGFDPGYRQGLWDIDYCLRLRQKGYRVVFTPYAELVRREEPPEVLAEDRERFRERWREWIERDPAYNPNLSLESGGYGLAWPPRIRRPWRQ
ncbi:glycosyltransferase [Methylacidimicrobium sp. B4]|uniref:glycosyltransferase family 2 protein n=1 Tax=Methylacidimicrobium sp. B4 TaxID=2796139 RepID=UPI001A8D32C9|nr:glycosyltransferase [Methylacidimicrobium sp. B4]QSR84399.1 glycosyltransferase [Methylacidimicrobium sp. B4]